MKRLNFLLAAVALFLLLFALFKGEDKSSFETIANLFGENNQPFGFEHLDRKAKKLLKTGYVKPPSVKVPQLDGVNYDDYRQIVYRPEVSIWKNLGLPFQLQFFHPGHIYSTGIRVFEILDEAPTEIQYDASRFDFGNLKLPDQFARLSRDLHYTGFRIHYPLNQENALEEFAVFQGGSYFRVISKGQVYGLSARGLAVNTGLNEREEFPVFEEFYVKQPEKFDKTLQVFALLNSESVVGAYQFTFYPGEVSCVEVKARNYLRKKVKRLGFAPLTSMFLYGEADQPILGNIHPEVHDSDGLLIHTKDNQWEWRPLVNPKETIVTTLDADSFQGYGFIQRDHKFKSYQDDLMKYHLRPSAWVVPSNDWGKGKLHLLEIATNLDSDDNMGVFWEPEEHPAPKEPFDLNYKVYFQDRSPSDHTLAKISAFFRGSDPLYPKVSTLTVYFTGEEIKKLDRTAALKAVIETDREDKKDFESKLEKINELSQWRLVIRYSKEGVSFTKPMQWKIFLEKDNKQISETWIYNDGISK
ncbi:glucan biosynthesis protein [Leptospira idonii]|uniref:Glucans biosynthesis protein G n=1 Tax=Leptospira idonii TaxID=1193500 RepID=A0A4R9M2B7_9LEPT|nr:glucan biosynthesis protein [Leptospira idonii]TGN20252.1 glucans biosynthesis protein [Leptospira idonii]